LCTEPSGFSYVASPSGGSGQYSYAWSFSGPSPVTPSSSNAQSGSAGVPDQPTGGGAFTGNLIVTDGRSDVTCTAPASATTQVFTPQVVHISVATAAQQCPGMTTDAVTFGSTVTGGSAGFGGNTFSYSWRNQPGCSGTSCTINPSDSLFCDSETTVLTVTDPVCGVANSETGRYSKVTTVTASVGP
jgi:hypothetical protein